MKITLIAALSKNYVIGQANQLPWRLPADLKHFKALTLNKIIVMGRKTYDSLGKALPHRTNIVVSRNPHLTLSDAEVFSSLEAVLKKFAEEKEIYIIGGAELFKQSLPLATHLQLTWVKADITGDTYFPEFDQSAWQEESRESHQADEHHLYDYDFVEYVRIR